VLTWNLYKASRAGWSADFTRLARGHDLLLLQEGLLAPHTTPVFTGVEGMAWWLGCTFELPLEPGSPRTGTMIGSRSRPAGPIVFRHSPHREALVYTPKSHIGATFSLSGTEARLLAISVHATNIHVRNAAFEAHVDQILEGVAAHRGPIVLAGDFNTWNVARTDYLFARTEALGLRPIYPRGPATEGDDGRMTWLDNYLDHAFVRGLEVVGEPHVLTEVESSDHKALSFELAARANDRISAHGEGAKLP
jgi:endonuclease/exonuclease/phosphatase (EEP) superfamily protein YafD